MKEAIKILPAIQPIDVIERWALCHHLGCVVKYLAQAGRKNPASEQVRPEQLPQRCGQHTAAPARPGQACPGQAPASHSEQARLDALKKAEWYLARELSLSQPCSFVPLGPQPFTTEAILDDWDLSFHLSETLFHIKASKSPSMRGESLKQAMWRLKAEIALVEQRLSKTTLENTGDQ